MEKPFKYTAIHKLTKEARYFNDMLLKPYQFSSIEYEWVIWIDTRYEAKLRLFYYVTKTKPFRYNPFEGTEIGKSIPILNF